MSKTPTPDPLPDYSNRFIPQKASLIDQEIKKKTYGLVKLEEFQRIKSLAIEKPIVNEKNGKKKRKKTLNKAKLSFDEEGHEETGMYGEVFERESVMISCIHTKTIILVTNNLLSETRQQLTRTQIYP